MTTRQVRRGLRAACLAAGAACLVTAGSTFLGGSAQASGLGSRFESLGLIGESGGVRILDRASGQPSGTFEGDTPFAQVSLTTAGGRAFATVAWPGGFFGNAGSTFTLLTGQTLPTDANDPVRAEAQTGGGAPTQTKDVPGGTMFASAKPTSVLADALYGNTQKSAQGSLGTTHARSLARITGVHSAFSTTSSITENIDLGGVITIGSVRSDAKVTTNGIHSAGSGHTTVSDMSIGGVPVTVDESGVHAQGQGTGLGSATAAVNQVLANFDTTIFLTQPTTTIAPNGMTYNAGSLVISTTVLGGRGFILEFGGAMAVAGSTLNSVYSPPPPPPFSPPPVPPGTTGGTTGTSSGGYVPGPPITGGTTGGTTGGPQPVYPPTTNAGFTVPRHPLSAGWIVTALLGSALIAAGLRRFPDRVLEQTAAPCPLGDK